MQRITATLLADPKEIKYPLEVETDRETDAIREAGTYIEQTTNDDVIHIKDLKAQLLHLLRTQYKPRNQQITKMIEDLKTDHGVMSMENNSSVSLDGKWPDSLPFLYL